MASAQGATGYVLIDWPDDAPETMLVRFEGGTMQVELPSVGNFAFRSALPKVRYRWLKKHIEQPAFMAACSMWIPRTKLGLLLGYA